MITPCLCRRGCYHSLVRESRRRWTCSVVHARLPPAFADHETCLVERQLAQGPPAPTARMARSTATRRRLSAGDQASRMADFPRVRQSRPCRLSRFFSGQKTYNGVALLTRETPIEVIFGNPLYPDEQKRLLAATVDGSLCGLCLRPEWPGSRQRQVCLQAGWLDALARWSGELLDAEIDNSSWPAISTLRRMTATYTTRSPGPDRSCVRSPSVQLSSVCSTSV
jgi:hypothetical protein